MRLWSKRSISPTFVESNGFTTKGINRMDENIDRWRYDRGKNNLCSNIEFSSCCFVLALKESKHIFSRRCSAILFIDVKVLRRFAWIGWHHQDYQLLIQVFIYKREKKHEEEFPSPRPLNQTYTAQTFNRFKHKRNKKKNQNENSETRKETMEKANEQEQQ